jgi:hypothetical protein
MYSYKYSFFICVFLLLNFCCRAKGKKDIVYKEVFAIDFEKLGFSDFAPRALNTGLIWGTYIYFTNHSGNVIYTYNIKTNTVEDKLNYVLDSMRYTSRPFFVDSNRNVYCFTNTNATLSIVNQLGSIKSVPLTGIYNNEMRNRAQGVISTVATNKGMVIINLFSRYNAETKSTYFDYMSKLPLFAMYTYEGDKKDVIPVYTSLPEKDTHRLTSFFHVFDYDKYTDNIYYQHLCSNTIFRYNLSSKQQKNINITGSQYNIQPQWYNPKDELEEEVMLRQNTGSYLYVDGNKELIYRYIKVNQEEGSTFIFQVISFKGKVLAEKNIGQQASYMIRYEDGLYYCVKEENKMFFYKIELL